MLPLKFQTNHTATVNLQKRIIYLDNNATTPVDPRVLEVMMPYFTTNFANASSTHKFGLEAHNAVKKARKQVADLIGAEPYEIIFTSGATEAINMAMQGVAENYSGKGKHIITVSTEHPAVLDTCRYLEGKGFEVSYLGVDSEGLIRIEELKSELRTDTILVSVMHVNNETGVIQPIAEIAEIAHSVGAFFMTDATQSAGKIPVSVDAMGIDLLCLSGHKMYAPKGVGALFFRQRLNKVKIPALMHGGGHERGLRSGTLNVPGIVGLGAACEIASKEMLKNAKEIGALRDYLEYELLKIEGASVNGSLKNRLYNTTNLRFDGVDSDALILGLSNPEDDETPMIAVSNGSACSSASIMPSHVLLGMGLIENDAHCCVRFSLGIFFNSTEISLIINGTIKIIKQLRNMNVYL
jgi:cysteine desulfurase